MRRSSGEISAVPVMSRIFFATARCGISRERPFSSQTSRRAGSAVSIVRDSGERRAGVTAELIVDSAGLVKVYPGGWESVIAESS